LTALEEGGSRKHPSSTYRDGLKPSEVLRTKEEKYKKLVAGKDLSDDELIRLMAANPEIIQRPLVVRGKKSVLARPVDRLEKLGV
jgi:arsenate reductase-like glutaredoxin family protein